MVDTSQENLLDLSKEELERRMGLRAQSPSTSQPTPTTTEALESPKVDVANTGFGNIPDDIAVNTKPVETQEDFMALSKDELERHMGIHDPKNPKVDQKTEEIGRTTSAINSFVTGLTSMHKPMLVSSAIRSKKVDQEAIPVFDNLDATLPADPTKLDPQELNRIASEAKRVLNKDWLERAKNSPNPPPLPTRIRRQMAMVDEYITGNFEARQKIREELNLPITERPRFKEANEFTQSMQNNFPTNPKFTDEFWASALPNTLGTISTQLLLAAGTGGAGPLVTGVEAGGADMFLDAIESGATEEEALDAAGWGSVVGALEVVPVFKVLDRFNKGTGGGLKKYLVDAAKDGTTEVVQEALQQTAKSLIASEVVGYDPERQMIQVPFVDNNGNQTLAEFSTTAFMSLIASYGGAKARVRREVKAEETAERTAEVKRVREESTQLIEDRAKAATEAGVEVTPSTLTGGTEAGGRQPRAASTEQLAETTALGAERAIDVKERLETQEKTLAQSVVEATEKGLDSFDRTKTVPEKTASIQEAIQAESDVSKTRVDDAYSVAKTKKDAFIPRDKVKGLTDLLMVAGEVDEGTLGDKASEIKSVLDTAKQLEVSAKDVTVEGKRDILTGETPTTIEQGADLTFKDALAMRKKLSAVSQRGTPADRFVAGNMARALDNFIAENEGSITGDADAIQAWRSASQAQREHTQRFGKSKQQKVNVVADILSDDKPLSLDKMNARLFGRSEGKFTPDLGTNMNQLKKSFGEDHAVYKLAQEAIATKLFEKAGKTGEALADSGEFNVKAFNKNLDNILQNHSDVLRDHMPDKFRESLSQIHTITKAVEAAGNDKSAIAKSIGTNFTKMERFVTNLQTTPTGAGGIGINPEFALTRSVLATLSKALTLKKRKKETEAATTPSVGEDPNIRAQQEALKSLEQDLKSVEETMKRKQKKTRKERIKLKEEELRG